MFNVTVTANHPANGPCEIGLSIPDDSTPERMSATMLQALDAAQHKLELPSSQDELVASRGTFSAIADLLDDLGVEPDGDGGMLALVRRLSVLGNEVRRLRAASSIPDVARQEWENRLSLVVTQRDAAHARIRAHGTVINKMRRRLGVGLGTPDTELPRIVGELQDKGRDFHRVHKSMADTIREVRVALNVGQETFDSELGEIARAFRFGNVDPHTQGRPCPAAVTLREVTDALGLPVGVLTTSGTRVARKAAEEIARRADRAVELDEKLNDALLELESLGRFVADADGGPEPTSRDDLGQRLRLLLNNRAGSASPEQLARALFDASREVAGKRGSEPIPIIEKSGWENAHPARRVWWLEVASETLASVGVNVPTSLLPVTPEELAKAMFEQHIVNVLPWEKAPESSRNELVGRARRILDSLPSVAAPKPTLPVTPEQLARAIHEGMGADSRVLAGELTWAPWEHLRPQTSESLVRVAEIVLSELPQIARRDGEADREFAAHADAQLAGLRRENEAAVEAFREIAPLVGMSFGGADDMRVLGETTATAVARLKRERDDLLVAGNDANSEMHSYRGMVMFVADTMGMSAEVVDDAAKFGRAFRTALKARPTLTVNMCAPAPQDWVIELRPKNPLTGAAEGEVTATLPSGSGLAMEDGLFAATLRYVGTLQQRPARELLLPSVSAEQLGRAWLETPASTSPGLPWGEVHPEMREGFVAHAARVIEALSGPMWTDLARRSRKRGIAVDGFRPGEFFTADGVKARGFMLSDEQAREARLSAAMQDGDAKTISDVIGSLFGDRVSAVAGQGPLLEQLRKQGEQLRSWERKAERSRGHHKLIAESLGRDEFSSPAQLAEYARELRDEVSRLQVGWDGFRREMSAALGCAPMTPDNLLLETARERVLGLMREKGDRSQDLSRALGFNSGESWEDMIEFVTGRTADHGTVMLERNAFAEICRILGLPEKQFPAGVVDAVRGLKRSHGDAEGQLLRLIKACCSTQEMLATKGDGAVAVDRALARIAEWRDFRETAIAPFRSGDLGRMSDAVIALVEAAGIAVDGSMAHDVVADKASDAAAVLRSWPRLSRQYPRLLSALGVEGDALDPDQPEVAERAFDKIETLTSLRDSVIIPGGSGEVRRIKDAVETLLEAAEIDLEEDFVRPDVTVQKAGDAAAILRSWPDVLRAVNAFESAEVEQPDEVGPLLRHYAEVFYKADRRGRVIEAVERLLAAHRGESLRDNPDTIYERLDKLIGNLFEPLREVGQQYGVNAADYVDKQRFAEYVLLAARNHVALSPAPMWASWAEQIAAKLEQRAIEPDESSPTMVHTDSMLYAAAVVRAHSAALVSGGELHPLAVALLSGTSWAPNAESSELELTPYTDGAVALINKATMEDPLVLSTQELAPVGAALLALSFHQVREAGLKRQREEREATAERAEVEAAAGAPPVQAMPTVPQEWCYGPNSIDPDPGKRWHMGCGGEVLTIDGVDICGNCQHEWTPEEAEVSQQRADELKDAVELDEVLGNADEDSAP